MIKSSLERLYAFAEYAAASATRVSRLRAARFFRGRVGMQVGVRF